MFFETLFKSFSSLAYTYNITFWVITSIKFLNMPDLSKLFYCFWFFLPEETVKGVIYNVGYCNGISFEDPVYAVIHFSVIRNSH